MAKDVGVTELKRYRLVSFCFDSLPSLLAESASDGWVEETRRLHEENRRHAAEYVLHEYGDHHSEFKLKNLVDLGNKPFMIPGYHHVLLEQVRRAFVCFGYYPALTGACALGERVLNHLVLQLRDDFRGQPEYKRVYRKNSFADWSAPIEALASWRVLLPEVAQLFRELRDIRNKVVHFSSGLEHDTRTPALGAIHLVTDIVGRQFSACGPQPWFIPVTAGEVYIKKEAESWPFVREFYLPMCSRVGPHHCVTEITPESGFVIADDFDYGNRDVTDDDYMDMRAQAMRSGLLTGPSRA